jgi:HSP20 family molecular chaperone IbpA
MPDDYLVFLDCPGVPGSALRVHLSRNQLLVSGEHEECFSRGMRRACWDRSVEEILELPDDADQEKVEAWMGLQVLVVRIPRKEVKVDKVVKVAEKGTIDKILERVGLED